MLHAAQIASSPVHEERTRRLRAWALSCGWPTTAPDRKVSRSQLSTPAAAPSRATLAKRTLEVCDVASDARPDSPEREAIHQVRQASVSGGGHPAQVHAHQARQYEPPRESWRRWDADVRQAPVREFRATPVRTEPGYRQAGAQGGNRTHDLRLTKALLRNNAISNTKPGEHGG